MATNPLLPPTEDRDPARTELSAVPNSRSTAGDIAILLPSQFYNSLGRRLLAQLRDVIFPQKYPPLRITSRPISVILPLGEMLRAPWYRTIFTNLGDVLAPESLPPLQLESRPVEVQELVSDITSEPWWRSLLRSLGEAISPEKLPPLELESRPVDVGELISDASSKPWWGSLIRSLADLVSPETLPALELTSTAINPGISEVGLVTPHWASLISAPVAAKVPLRASLPLAASQVPVVRHEPKPPANIAAALPVPLEALQVDEESVDVLVAQFKDNLSRSKLREVIWISLASAEIILLIAFSVGWLS